MNTSATVAVAVAVADGEKFNLFRNAGDEAGLKLTPLAHDAVDGDHQGSTPARHGSSANPDGGGLRRWLLRRRRRSTQPAGPSRPDSSLLIIAAPRTLGAIRPQYHARLTAVLVGEIAKDLTGHALQDVENAIAAA